MKSSKLIELLKEADPTGETEVFVGGDDIFYVEMLPAYYDGCPTVLIRDKSKEPYYDVVGLKHLMSGNKICIKTLDVDDCLLNDTGIQIDYSDLTDERATIQKECDERLRQENIQIHKQVSEYVEKAKE